MPPKTNQISPFVQSLENSQRTEEETAFKTVKKLFSFSTKNDREAQSRQYSKNKRRKRAYKKKMSIVPFEGMEM